MAAQLIVALDLPRKEDALVLARELQGAVPWCKVGMELFTLAGPDIIRELHDLGFHVFLDMKFYDIPHTVAQAVKAAAAAGAELLTLHCQGGERMCSEARIAADSYGSKAPQLFGVTALTSFGPGEMPGISADPSDFALELAGKLALYLPEFWCKEDRPPQKRLPRCTGAGPVLCGHCLCGH